MKSRLSKGQAEIIGGLIVVSTLLLIVIPLIMNLMTTSTTITTRGYTIRSQFEISRWSEKLISNKTHIINPSSVDIEIVRIWLKDGTLKEFNPWIKIPITSSIPIEVLGINNISEIDIIVTSRGRVFKIEELLPPIIIPPIQYPPLGLRSEDIIGGQNIYNVSHIIYANYSRDGTTWHPGYAGFYVDGDGWYINLNGTWVKIDKTGEEAYTDLDNNKARELVVLLNTTDYSVVKGGLQGNNIKILYINITFKDLVYVSNITSFITVFLKPLVGLSTQADAYVYIEVSLTKSDNRTISISSPATLSYTKVARVEAPTVIYQGYIMFPIAQFVGYSILQQNPGYYDLTVLIAAEAESDTDIRCSLEYVGVAIY